MATKLQMKGPVIALLCLPAIAGCVMLLQIPHDNHHNGALLAGYYIVSFYDVVCMYSLMFSRSLSTLELVCYNEPRKRLPG